MSFPTTLPEEFESRVAALAGAGVHLMDLARAVEWPIKIPWRVVLRHGHTCGHGTGQTISAALRAAEQDLRRNLALAPAELPSLDDLEL